MIFEDSEFKQKVMKGSKSVPRLGFMLQDLG
jgi:hypothetical protein